LKISRLQPRINNEGSGATNYCSATFDAGAAERDLIFEDVVVAVTVKVAVLLTTTPWNPGALAVISVFPIQASPVTELYPVTVANPVLLMVATCVPLEAQVT
jgi:hypothetical protein